MPGEKHETVLAVGSQALASSPWAGIGLSAFGATMRYGGIGFTLALGNIR